jgi:BMFP domain-containing protein YqiC
LQSKISLAIESSPAKGIGKNVKVMMTQGFPKLDRVRREAFDIPAQVLVKTRAKLEALELRAALAREPGQRKADQAMIGPPGPGHRSYLVMALLVIWFWLAS